MGELKEKIDLLERKGFKYLFDRDIYCNPDMRKCFSLEFIEDSTSVDIEKKISTAIPKSGGLVFYFNRPLPPGLEEDIKKEVKLRFRIRKKKNIDEIIDV